MPNDRIPAVEHALFVRVGAADDPYGKTGIAHYLEHLMFTGSANYPEGSYDGTIATIENVGKLAPAWQFSTGVLRGHEGAPADEDEVVITLPSGHEFRGVPDVLRALQGVLDQILPPCAVEIKVDKYWDAVELIEGAEKSFCPSCQFPYFLIPTS